MRRCANHVTGCADSHRSGDPPDRAQRQAQILGPKFRPFRFSCRVQPLARGRQRDTMTLAGQRRGTRTLGQGSGALGQSGAQRFNPRTGQHAYSECAFGQFSTQIHFITNS